MYRVDLKWSTNQYRLDSLDAIWWFYRTRIEKHSCTLFFWWHWLRFSMKFPRKMFIVFKVQMLNVPMMIMLLNLCKFCLVYVIDCSNSGTRDSFSLEGASCFTVWRTMWFGHMTCSWIMLIFHCLIFFQTKVDPFLDSPPLQKKKKYDERPCYSFGHTIFSNVNHCWIFTDIKIKGNSKFKRFKFTFEDIFCSQWLSLLAFVLL